MSASDLNVTPVLGISGDASYNRTKITDYVGNKIYENGSLKRILVDGGYIENNAYHYYLADHLGNNRVVANQNAEVKQVSHYYPFGMAFADGVGQAAQPYKFSGKELDTELGLNIYDSQARQLTSGLPRFTSVDPLAELFHKWSPYVYCLNNPMRYIDLTGMAPTDSIKNDTPENCVELNPVTVEADKPKVPMPSITYLHQAPSDYWQGTSAKSSAGIGALGAFGEAKAGTYVVNMDKYGYKGKYYSGTKYSSTNKIGSGKIPIRLVKAGKVLGGASGALTVGSSLAGIREHLINPKSPNAVAPAKGGLDIGMAAYAYFVPGVGAGYFVVDATIGWEPVIQANVEVIKAHDDIKANTGWWYPTWSEITQY